MRRLIEGLTASAVAIGALAVAADAASAGPKAAVARSCPTHVITTHRTFRGQHYTYRIRVSQVSAVGIGCTPARGLIHRSGTTLKAEPGVYQRVPPWACRAFRPFAGGPHGELTWFSDCKRSGNHSLKWTETQLSAHHGEADNAGGAAARIRSCGTFRVEGAKFSATVLRGTVKCGAARRVLKDFLSGKGRMHGPPNGPAYKQTWTVDGWTCGHGTGGGACIHGGKTYKTARAGSRHRKPSQFGPARER